MTITRMMISPTNRMMSQRSNAMPRFTDSPYERMMTQLPGAGRHTETGPPPASPEQAADGHPCAGCPYGRGTPCIGFCMKELMEPRRKEKR